MNDNLSPDQFPRITKSRHEYGSSVVETEPHHVPDGSRTLAVQQYVHHDGDQLGSYVEARGSVLKKDGTPGKQHGYKITKRPPPHVLEEMKRLRGES